MEMQQEQVQQEQVESKKSNKKAGKVGLGGWLIIAQIGLYMVPFAYSLVLLQVLDIMFDSSKVLNSGVEQEGLMWTVYLAYQLIMCLFMIVVPIYLLIQLYGKKRILPKAIITFYLLGFVILLIDYVLLVALGYDAANPKLGDLIKNAIASTVWILYFKKSIRVKNTFVN
ncbi:DUF2569 domain-containing protein [Paenibacillus sp. N1-5-1-14]|uniref:DUF2569 domain-containing protein n=1 Tax=Paenibacillus radicibacter TaxID=2972488 RepID=UPI0021592B6E|nr:DUF2569 domain-containing protein [Paenibacillus radicibacter]MCR8644395.1 DUF2569 domain-containing protein [Paenibacillus radicibacter]